MRFVDFMGALGVLAITITAGAFGWFAWGLYDPLGLNTRPYCRTPPSQERFYTDVEWLPRGVNACGCFVGVGDEQD